MKILHCEWKLQQLFAEPFLLSADDVMSTVLMVEHNSLINMIDLWVLFCMGLNSRYSNVCG